MINFKVLFHFIKKIITNWIIYLGFLPKVYDYIGAYFKWEYTLPTWAIISFTVLVIVYAIYKAYEEEYISREKLEKRLAGPTRYNVTAILTPIDFQEEKLVEHLKSLKKEAEKKLQTLPEKISISKSDMYASALSQATASYFKKDKSPQAYNETLNEYEFELNSLVDNADDNEKLLADTIKSYEEKFFFVDFLLTNTGITSDSDININIKCQNENIVLEKKEALRDKMNFLRLFPAIPKEPSKPKSIEHNMFASQHLEIDRFSNLNQFNNIEPLHAYRKQHTMKDHTCSVTIRDLHVGGEIDIFDKEFILMKDDDVDFTITIKSKESTKVLTPDVIVKKLEVKKPLYPSNKEAE